MRWLKRFWPLVLGLLYLVSPIDAIPDSILGLGWADDIILLFLAYWLVKRFIGEYSQTESHNYGGPGQGEPESSAEQDPYKVLGVSRTATPEEIKSAYRKQAQRYHPDRVSHLGEELQQLAKQKFLEIQKAYEILSNGTG